MTQNARGGPPQKLGQTLETKMQKILKGNKEDPVEGKSYVTLHRPDQKLEKTQSNKPKRIFRAEGIQINKNKTKRLTNLE